MLPEILRLQWLGGKRWLNKITNALLRKFLALERGVSFSKGAMILKKDLKKKEKELQAKDNEFRRREQELRQKEEAAARWVEVSGGAEDIGRRFLRQRKKAKDMGKGKAGSSYDPTSKYLSFVDNGDFSVDGVLSGFPVTPATIGGENEEHEDESMDLG